MAKRISLYIPHVFKYTKQHEIVATLNLLSLGHVERVDLIQSSNTQQQAFIHLSELNEEKYPDLRARINNGESFKIVYDDPWFWKVFKSRSPKPPFKERKIPHIIFENKTKPQNSTFNFMNKYPDQGCGIIDPIFKKGAQELKDWGPAEFTIGRH